MLCGVVVGLHVDVSLAGVCLLKGPSVEVKDVCNVITKCFDIGLHMELHRLAPAALLSS